MTKRLARTGGRRVGMKGQGDSGFSASTSAVIDFASVSANTRGTGVAVTVNGAAVGDQVDVVPAAGAPANAGIALNGFVTAANTVTVYPFNVTTGAIDPASATYNISVRRPLA